jgi:hypothetical protein
MLVEVLRDEAEGVKWVDALRESEGDDAPPLDRSDDVDDLRTSVGVPAAGLRSATEPALL